MSFYSDMAQVALDLLRQFGQTVTITREDNTVNPVTGATTTVTTSGTFTAINPPASGGTIEAFDNRLASDSSIMFSNLRFLIIAAQGAPFEPRASDKVTLQGKNYFILGVTPINPEGTPLVYKVGMRV